MTLEPFATVKDLAARWRELSVTELSRAEVLLADASNTIRRKAGDSFEFPDELTEATLVMVTCEMVKRAMMTDVDTPAINSSQTGIGPFQKTLNYANPTADLYLTKSEKEMLGIGKQRIGVILPLVNGQ